MPRIRYFDPQSHVLEAARERRPPEIPPDQTKGHGIPNRPNDLLDVQLEAIRRFRDQHPDEADLLESNRVLGISVRDLSECMATHPGNVSRKILRIEKRLRIEMLAHSMSYLFQSDDGFTLCPKTAAPLMALDCYAVGLSEFGIDFTTLPTPSECSEYLHSVWQTLHATEHQSFYDSAHARYLGGWHDNGRFWLDVSLLILNKDDALERARRERQRCVFHLATGTLTYL